MSEIDPKGVVDLGCGGGRNAGERLKLFSKAHVTPIYYSELSLVKAKKYNRDMNAGRCVVQQGDMANLKLPEERFDLATAFETVYFWPGLAKCFSRVATALKSGGE